MSTAASTTKPQTPSHQNVIDALITQLSIGPDLTDVAAVLLRQSLQQLYPTLDLDPSITMVGTPSWGIFDDEIVAGPIRYQALTEILANLTVYEVPVLYIEGEHFLTQQPITEPAVHLPVRIDEIAKMINLLAPVMLKGFQEQQVEFWNKAEGTSGPRWHELSNTLRNVWNVDQVKGWSNDDCNMALTLFRTPDLSTNGTINPYQCKAYLVAIDLTDGKGTIHWNEASMVVLVGKQQDKTVILTHSLLKGFEKFDSLEKLGATLPEHVKSIPHQIIQWRLVEPGSNVFDYQACALISIQIDVIGALDFVGLRHTRPKKPLLTPEVGVTSTPAGPGLEWFKDALPDWLGSASIPDMNNYARHLKDLAVLHSQNAGKTYLEGIPPIEQYALDAMKAKMDKDHPDATKPELSAVEIRVRSLVVWGTFVVPGKFDISRFSAADLALQNLIALPSGDKSIHATDGKQLPAWMTVEYVEELVSEADIGSAYPTLIKNKLLDDATESARRKDLYTQHLRIQLPLLALQCKIREQAGIDARGYRYVVAVMEPVVADRVVEGQTIVIRPLAFAPLRRKDGSKDVVANMFVIGPQDPAAGPCLLYRPMLDQPLTQYPSPSNLLYAIQQSASLRESVLAWLPDDARSDYAAYVFPDSLPSPWAAIRFLVDSTALTTMTGPIALGQDALKGDLFAALFKANTDALVELANRQSVSNAENRWASFKRAGWMVFNAVLPFLGRTVGIGAWIWQVLDQLQALHDAHEREDKQAQWAAFADVLLNLGMAITLHIATHGPSGKPLANDEPMNVRPEVPETVKVSVTQLASSTLHEASSFQRALNISGAVNRTPDSLGTVLDRFKITPPEGLGSAHSKEGIHKHLYGLNQKWYAPVGQRWFEVSVDDSGNVAIIDSSQPTRWGPALINNAKGEWFVDTRLRLRGGGWPSVSRSAQAQATVKANEMRTKLTAFESRKAIMQAELQQAHQAMTDAPTATAEAKRQLYLQKLESQRAEYAAALGDLKSLHAFSPTADYQQKSLGYLNAQLELIHAGIREALTTFTPKMRTVLNQIERQAEAPQDRHFEDAQQIREMSQDMITRLGSIESRVAELRDFEKEGMRLIQQTRQRLPSYTVDDLKALQITISRNLCLPEHTVATMTNAWSTLDRIVDSADMAVQVLLTTLDERSVYRLEERIDTLNNLIEQFNVIDERLTDFNSMHSGVVLEAPVTHLRQQLNGFKNRAARNLITVLEERDAIRARPSLPVPPPRPKNKFIRTRYNGVLIGQARLTPQGLETDLVDITSPLTQKVIATFHRKNSDHWVKHVEDVSTVNVTPDLDASIGQGQTLLDELPAFNARMVEQTKQPGRSPFGIEYLFHQHAMELEQASSAIEHALTGKNATESSSTSAVGVNKALQVAVEKIYQQATSSMLTLIKDQPPTLSGIEWLKNRQEIKIAKTINRRRLKGGKTRYLDEYAIRDQKSGKDLWYAHFLYSTDWVPAKAFLYGRLKTPKEQSLGLDADSPKGLHAAQQLAYYRSMIGFEQAQTLFFELKKQPL
ncbi:dermonecrotic toxin domain-containing protein [Pseudomonas migulae]|uniref:dermonecrotic toxin domain-containing protein n=1 Tax=Pseudomonas migulae TaxID=78543 RepID=UPI003714EAB8